MLTNNEHSAWQGELDLFWRERDLLQVEEQKIQEPLPSLPMLKRCGIITQKGVNDCSLETSASTLNQPDCVFSSNFWLEPDCMFSNICVNLESPWDERDEVIAEQINAMDLVDMTCQFPQRR